MTRQRLWQIRQAKAGRCGYCGRAAKGLAGHCRSCREKKRRLSRNYYRRKAGIPTEAPLGLAGRKRKYP